MFILIFKHNVQLSTTVFNINIRKQSVQLLGKLSVQTLSTVVIWHDKFVRKVFRECSESCFPICLNEFIFCLKSLIFVKEKYLLLLQTHVAMGEQVTRSASVRCHWAFQAYWPLIILFFTQPVLQGRSAVSTSRNEGPSMFAEYA